MKLERLRRSGEQIGSEQAEAFLAHVHLRELVRKRTCPRLLIGRPLTETWRVDVLRLGWRTSIVGGLPRLATHLLLRELALRRKTGGKKLGRLRRLTGNSSTIGRTRSGQSFCAVVCLSLTSSILPTLAMMLRLRRGRRAWCLGHGGIALGVGERRLPLGPSRSGFCTRRFAVCMQGDKRKTHR